MQRNVLGSMTSRPVPPADTGSIILNWISDLSMRLVQLERRIDPWVRPAFDAVLRDPTARLTTWLINLQRKNDGLKIAEERIPPDEEALTQSIIDTFKAQALNSMQTTISTLTTQVQKSQTYLERARDTDASRAGGQGSTAELQIPGDNAD